jgi:hypothetical protein
MQLLPGMAKKYENRAGNLGSTDVRRGWNTGAAYKKGRTGGSCLKVGQGYSNFIAAPRHAG